MSDLYAMYLRKSRADAEAESHGEGETLLRHQRTLTELAMSRGLAIGKIYREIVSGDTISARPQMRALLEDVQSGMWKGVLCMETARLARGDTIDQGIVSNAFRCSATLIVTPSKTYDPLNDLDSDFFEFGLFMARQEYSLTKRRLQAGRIASVREGKWVSPRAPFGYRRAKLPNEKGWTLEIVPDQAEIVRSIFRWTVLENLGSPAIAARLRDMGVQRMFGAPSFTPDFVRSILRNSVYTGRITWNRRVTVARMENGRRVLSRPLSGREIIADGVHPPIISDAEFDAAQRHIAARTTVPVRGDCAMTNPLSGLIRCSVCGRSMLLRHSDRSPALVCPTPGCPTVSASFDAVREDILRALRDIRIRPLPAASPDAENETKLLQRQSELLQRRVRRVRDLLEQELYTPSEYAARKEELLRQIAIIQDRIAEIRSAEPSPMPESISLPELCALSQSAEHQHALLESVIDHADYAKTVRCRRGDPPDANLVLTIFLRASPTSRRQ